MKEIPWKTWLMTEAERLHIKPNCLRMRIERGLVPLPKLRKITKRVIMVRL